MASIEVLKVIGATLNTTVNATLTASNTNWSTTIQDLPWANFIAPLAVTFLCIVLSLYIVGRSVIQVLRSLVTTCFLFFCCILVIEIYRQPLVYASYEVARAFIKVKVV